MIVNFSGQKIPLPDFFLVGAAKSGTTSLINYLSRHPDIFVPKVKEPQFFAVLNSNYNNSKPQPFFCVENLWEYSSLFERAGRDQIIGEASTWYSVPVAVDNTISNFLGIYKELAGNLKFIFIIRNPLERLLSSYNMYLKMGLENLSFEEAVFAGRDRIAKGYRYELNYIENMFVADSIRKYITAFGKSNVKVCLYETLKEKPDVLIREIFEFLGVTSNFIPENLYRRYNVSGIVKSPIHRFLYYIGVKYNPFKPVLKKVLLFFPKLESDVRETVRKLFFRKVDISLTVRDRLKRIFKQEVEELGKIVNKDLSYWLD